MYAYCILRMYGMLEITIWYAICQHNMCFSFFAATRLKPTCSHHFCRSGYRRDIPTWAKPYIPMLILDPGRQWESPDCPNCKGKCSRHFLAPDVAILSPLKGMTKSPSVYIKEMFDKFYYFLY